MSVTGYTKAGADNAYRYGTIGLDEFSGATDDAKLSAAMTYAAAQTHPPVIQLTNRDYSFTSAITPYTGFRLRGPLQGQQNAELGDANVACRVNLATGGPWINNSAETFDGYVGGIAFDGNSSSTVFGGTGLYHCWSFRDITAQQCKSVYGTTAQKMVATACLIDGYQQGQGMYDTYIHIGGSDCRLFMDGSLTATSSAYQSGSSTYTYWFDGCDNAVVGALYESCIANRGGVKVSGKAYNTSATTNQGMLTMLGPTIEGGDPDTKACNGSCLRVEGGQLKLFGGYIGRGMAAPSTFGNSPVDQGLIHIESGAVLLTGVTVDMSTANTESSFLSVYVNAANAPKVRVRDFFTGTRAKLWTGIPRVHATAAGVLTADDSCTTV